MADMTAYYHARPALLAVLLGLLVCAATLVYQLSSKKARDAVPRVGSHRFKGIFSVQRHLEQLQAGIAQHPHGLFSTPIFPFGTVFVANGAALINEIRTGPDDVFSPAGAVEKFVQSKYTTPGTFVSEAALHKPIIRNQMTRGVEPVVRNLVDEIEHAFAPMLAPPASSPDPEWRAFPALETFIRIMAQCTNRIYVGAPLCRDPVYQGAVVGYATQVMKSAYIINMFPDWTHPYVPPPLPFPPLRASVRECVVVGKLVTDPTKFTAQLTRLLAPEIERRRRALAEYGPGWADKPDDFLMWLMEDAPAGFLQSTEVLVAYILFVNFASIHTTSMQFTHLVYDIAVHPEYVGALREEAAAVLGVHGWTKGALERMPRLESVLRESARLSPTNLVSLGRQLLKDWTFANGVTVRKGAFVAASTFSTHWDEETYPDARAFRPWRFFHEGDDSGKDRFTSTGNEFMAFGAGKHACPGRFFVAHEMKAMLCFILLNFDVKVESGPERPRDEYFGNSILPNRSAKVLFKRREKGMLPSASV
ncbi:cytochrome P450 [Daedalea quercina L-15889]|uniref:Cytochrome P450 n=1 Tax=Daedalea quercina L-15889 TaxID=1314783 RepID=A0A165LS55_9APHY|nr:cytochrome P450 [Daedalea quercina L-15889]